MKKASLTIVAIKILLMIAVASTTGLLAGGMISTLYNSPEVSETPEVILHDPKNEALVLINQTREDRELPKLGVDARLNTSAEAKCAHMVENDYWSHSGAGTEWPTFVRDQGIDSRVGEILARTTHGDYAIQHQAWLDSPAHHAAIVDDYRAFGVGECSYKDSHKLTVVHFRE